MLTTATARALMRNATRATRATSFAAVTTLVTASLALPLGAQPLGASIARVSDGTVRMTFASRPDICGRGTSIVRNAHSTTTWDNESSRDVEWNADCDHGPVRVVFEVRDHEIVRLRTYVGGRWRAPSASTVDLGTVRASDAATFLVSLADTLPSKPGRDAIFPATLADSATVWPSLVRLARNEDRARETRRQAVFWLSQLAGDAVTPSLDSLVGDARLDRDVREQAIFALSQRPKNEGVPALLRVARTSRDGELRRKAMFWLGQSNDPRAIALFEELLAKE